MTFLLFSIILRSSLAFAKTCLKNKLLKPSTSMTLAGTTSKPNKNYFQMYCFTCMLVIARHKEEKIYWPDFSSFQTGFQGILSYDPLLPRGQRRCRGLTEGGEKLGDTTEKKNFAYFSAKKEKSSAWYDDKWYFLLF